jgi:hypothetical protein
MWGIQRVGRLLSLQRRRKEESVGRGHRESDGGGEKGGERNMHVRIDGALEEGVCVVRKGTLAVELRGIFGMTRPGPFGRLVCLSVCLSIFIILFFRW